MLYTCSRMHRGNVSVIRCEEQQGPTTRNHYRRFGTARAWLVDLYQRQQACTLPAHRRVIWQATAVIRKCMQIFTYHVWEPTCPHQAAPEEPVISYTQVAARVTVVSLVIPK
jgi:hypothetical protein